MAGEPKRGLHSGAFTDRAGDLEPAGPVRHPLGAGQAGPCTDSRLLLGEGQLPLLPKCLPRPGGPGPKALRAGRRRQNGGREARCSALPSPPVRHSQAQVMSLGAHHGHRERSLRERTVPVRTFLGEGITMGTGLAIHRASGQQGADSDPPRVRPFRVQQVTSRSFKQRSLNGPTPLRSWKVKTCVCPSKGRGSLDSL